MFKSLRSLAASVLSPSLLAALQYAELKTTRYRINFDRVGPRTRKSGYAHEHHCGARQEARYRRQIAAGQLTYNGKNLVLA